MLPVVLDQLTILYISIQLLTTGIFVDSSTVQPSCLRALVSLASKYLGTTEIFFLASLRWFHFSPFIILLRCLHPSSYSPPISDVSLPFPPPHPAALKFIPLAVYPSPALPSGPDNSPSCFICDLPVIKATLHYEASTLLSTFCARACINDREKDAHLMDERRHRSNGLMTKTENE